uniref:ubiquitinyl hydrolase 1 n=1 Tax=Chromera velia CCMP2878 TaxID=1169474 RepID=A0A0G4FEA7_9ALVE|eukprot:Cvel_16572.t1-p1 / transcript=Cvel_16572.t1 / gene=Cvel_16572 / organism=Chromera_velia_CCMP2878 / gene_product=hypothetical protein / transcript_product=hypothetical protein / location=Cvel_scaffold1282:27518-35779(-) / protein_length=2427 / sequence_SO=supercontig / SO=protein_coding / is_pseudo=false
MKETELVRGYPHAGSLETCRAWMRFGERASKFPSLSPAFSKFFAFCRSGVQWSIGRDGTVCEGNIGVRWEDEQGSAVLCEAEAGGRVRLRVLGLDASAFSGNLSPESPPKPQIHECGEVCNGGVTETLTLARTLIEKDNGRRRQDKKAQRNGPRILAAAVQAAATAPTNQLLVLDEDDAFFSERLALFNKHASQKPPTVEADDPSKLQKHEWTLFYSLAVELLRIFLRSPCRGVSLESDSEDEDAEDDVVMDVQHREELRILTESSDENSWFLWLLLDLELQIADVLGEAYTTNPGDKVEFLNKAMTVSQTAARRAVALTNGMAVRVAKETVGAVRSRLEEARRGFWQEMCKAACLSPEVLLKETELPRKDPVVHANFLPQERIDALACVRSLEGRRQESTVNMGKHMNGLATGMGPMGRVDGPELLLRLRAVERTVFGWLDIVIRDVRLECFRSFLHDLNQLDQLLRRYTETLNTFLSSKEPDVKETARSLPLSVLQSRETLVHWAAYCVAHAHLEADRGLGGLRIPIPLERADLWRLSVGTREAEDVLVQVDWYISRRGDGGVGRGLFALDKPDATLRWVDLFAQKEMGAPLRAGVKEERDREKKRRANFWAELQAKKQRLRDLRSQLSVAKVEEKRALDDYQWHVNTDTYASNRKWQIYRQKQSSVQSLEAQIENTNNDIPKTIFHLLPRGDRDALRVLFFLQTPSSLRVFARLSVAAQQVTLPRPFAPHLSPSERQKIRSLVTVTALQFDWRSHYDTFKDNWNVPSPAVIDPIVELFSNTQQVPKHWGPKKVDQISSGTDCEWYSDFTSDGAVPQLGWRGGLFQEHDWYENGLFNPFALRGTTEEVVDLFHTEPLGDLWGLSHEEDQTLKSSQQLRQVLSSFTVMNAVVRTDRDNIAVARQDVRPLWLDSDVWLAVGNLRAAKMTQISSLCSALWEDRLPLELPFVQVLVSHLLYQVGEVFSPAGGAEDSRFMWRHTLVPCDAATRSHHEPVLSEALSKVAEVLREQPRRHLAMFLLCPLVGFLRGQDEETYCAVADDLASTARRWAEMKEDEIRQGEREAGDEAVERQRGRRMMEATFLGYAALTKYDGSMSIEAVEELCVGLAVMHLRVQTGGTQRRCLEVLRHVYGRCLEIVTRRMGEILQVGGESLGRVLTEMARKVLGCGVVPVGTEIQWNRVGDSAQSCCFDAVTVAGSLLSINLATGCVLLDGHPPSTLPVSVTSNKLFMRTFGCAKFEVVRDSSGVMTTTAPVDGCFYTFLPLQNGAELRVTERASSTGAERRTDCSLQLLDHEGKWAAGLPRRLRELCSHWYSHSDQTVVMRGKMYFEREARHLLVGGGVAASMQWVCADVPLSLRAGSHKADKWRQLAQDAYHGRFGRHVILPVGCTGTVSRVLQQLQAVEDPEFIHVKEEPRGWGGKGKEVESESGKRPVLRFELPRVNDLSFRLVVESGRRCRLLCANLRGWRVSDCQLLLLPDCLYNFTQYLVLVRDEIGAEMSCGGQQTSLLLVPDGIVRSEGNTVTVSRPPGSGDKRVLHKVEVHPLFKDLRPLDPSGRLQLSLLHAAMSSLLEEERLSARGVQEAIRLVRACGDNVPLRQAERNKLDEIAVFANTQSSLQQADGHGLRLAVDAAFRRKAETEYLFSADADLNVFEDDPQEAKRLPHLSFGESPELQAAATRYKALEAEGPGSPLWNFRTVLLPQEKERAFGRPSVDRKGQTAAALRCERPAVGCTLVTPKPFLSHLSKEASDLDARTREQLISLLHQTKKRKRHGAGSVATFPLTQTTPAAASRLGGTMLKEQNRSWEKHQLRSAETTELGCSLTELKQILLSHLASVNEAERNLSACLLRVLWDVQGANSVGDCFSCNASVELFQEAGLRGRASLVDIARCAFDRERVLWLQPFLSSEGVRMVMQGCLSWLQLCSLAGLLARTASLCNHGGGGGASVEEHKLEEIQRALECSRRGWEPRDYPRWVAFEVDQQISIRVKQGSVACTLLREPDGIVQLNMGEGKTRVILPMLVLELTGKKKNLVRCNFLSQLLGDAWRHFREALQASPVFGLLLMRLPFFRQLKVPSRLWQRVGVQLRECRRSGGCLFVAPEHRLSLQLKAVESGSMASCPSDFEENALMELNKVLGDHLEGESVVDLIDESDRLLDPHYQLIYACGLQQGLPAGPERWQAAQAVSRVLGRLERFPRVLSVLQREGVSTLTANQRGKAAGGNVRASGVLSSRISYHETLPSFRRPEIGSFPSFLLAERDSAGFSLVSQRDLTRRVLEGILEDPPYDIQWLPELIRSLSEEERQQFLAFLSEAEATVDSLSPVVSKHLDEFGKRNAVLALRGFLVFDPLWHALSRRPSVDFGLRTADTTATGCHKTRMAVPYRGADTPALRAEFKNPDSAISFTLLAYYNDGLTETQVKETFVVFLRLG